MVAHVTPCDPAATHLLAAGQAALATHSGTVAATMQSYQLLYTRVLQQAKLWAFVDNFRLFGALALACIPLIFALKPAHGLAPKRTDAH